MLAIPAPSLSTDARRLGAISETSSNTAAATLIVPITIALCRSVGADPLVPSLAATAGASLGFMLPVSTAPNAIVFGIVLLIGTAALFLP